MRRQPAARGGGGRAAASAARAAARAAAGAAASGQVATAASERLDRARAPGAQASRALHHSLTSAPSQSQRRVHARRGDLVKRPDRRPYRGDHAQPARGRQSPPSRPSRSGAPLGNGGARRRVRVCRSPGAPSAPRLNVALVSCRDLKLTSRRRSLLAETRARGPDGSRMRSPQLARCSRDQLRRRMGQHGAALARGRGGGCEVFRAPPSLGRQLEARQRAGRRAASESTVVDALLATGSCPADPATPTGCGCVA